MCGLQGKAHEHPMVGDPTAEGATKWHRLERATEYAPRSLRMPETADLTSIHAKLNHGVRATPVALPEFHSVWIWEQAWV